MTSVELNECRQYIKDNYDSDKGLLINVDFNGHTAQRHIRVEKVVGLNDKLIIYPDSYNAYTYKFTSTDTVRQIFQNPIL